MGTQVVRRKSRTQVIDFQFTANGEASWSFKAEGDSEIYRIDTNNVASYTIEGASVALPFAVIDGNSYTVAITKTTPAQVADLQLDIWSGVDKTTVINVPDFGDFQGRYVYILGKTNNTVYVLDSDILKNNYLGGGSFSVSPIVDTITLPAPTSGDDWRRMCCFVKNGQPKILMINEIVSVTVPSANAVIINENNDVYDLLEQNQNQVSLFDSDITTNAYFALNYDYINQKILFGGRGLHKLDLTTGVADLLSGDKNVNSLAYEVDFRMNFEPRNLEFTRWYGHNYEELFFYGYRAVFQSINQCEYSQSLDRYFYAGNVNPFEISAVDRNGRELFAVTRAARPSTGNYQQMASSDKIGQGARFVYHATPGLVAVIYNHLDGSGTGQISFDESALCNNILSASISDFAELFICLEGTSDGLQNRMHFADITGYSGYFDLPAACIDLVTNKPYI